MDARAILSDAFEKETTTSVGAVAFRCHECNEQSQAQVLLYERKPYALGIPLGTEQEVLLKCERCGAEHLTDGISAEELTGVAPEAIDHYITKIKSPLFPKLLIVLLGMTWFIPFFSLIIWGQLKPYSEYIRGGWSRARNLFCCLTTFVHVALLSGFVCTLILLEWTG
jgi:hypothetical protein